MTGKLWRIGLWHTQTGLQLFITLDWGDWSILRAYVRDDGVMGWQAGLQIGPVELALDYDTGEF